MGDTGGVGGRPIRVIVHQPALAKYRLPVFRELASRDGLEVVVTFGRQRHLDNAPAEGFRVKALYIRRWLGGRFMWCTGHLRDIDRERPDAVVFTWNTRYLSLIPGMIRCRLRGIGTVLWGHGTANRRDSGWRGAIRRWVANRGDCLLFYDDGTAQTYVERYGFDASRVFVARNSIDQTEIRSVRERWLADPERLAEFRAEHGLGAGPVVLFVSRLIPENRVDLMLEAVAGLRERFDGIRAVVVGKGPALADLESMAESLGIKDRVTFTGGIYEENELAPWFLSAEVFCYPDYIGLSLMHSFGYGLAVVTASGAERHGPEFAALVDGENGRVYEPGEIESLRRVLGEMLSDPDRLAQLREGALRTVRERYSIEKMVDGMESSIRYAAGRSRG